MFDKFNTFHKNLKFTLEHEHLNKLHFLDVLISKDYGQIIKVGIEDHLTLYCLIHGIQMDQQFIKSI